MLITTNVLPSSPSPCAYFSRSIVGQTKLQTIFFLQLHYSLINIYCKIFFFFFRLQQVIERLIQKTGY